MNRFMLYSLLLLVILAADSFAQSQNMTLQVAGVSRKYILYAPTGLGSNPPLVYVIHGFNMSGQQEVGLTRMNAVADREKFLVVYPDALPDGSNQQSWDMAGANDYAFILAIIDAVDAKYKIDKNRIYASGFSQGGFFSFQLGCRYADIFAAIAPVSGLLNGTCSPKRPVPMIFTFGTNEGFDVNGFITSGDTWIKLNGCSTTPTVVKPYPSTNANSVVTRSTYSSCKEGADVVVQSVAGGTHEWPMNTNTKINNSEEVWAFFKKFSLQTATPVLSARENGNGRNMVLAYASGRVELRGGEGKYQVQVLDYRGRRVLSLNDVQGHFDFVRPLSGVYQVVIRQAHISQRFRLAIP